MTAHWRSHEGIDPKRYAMREQALAKTVTGLESYARVAQDQSDRGAIAMMGELVYRPLKAKVEELRK